jgi:hypothetical protein
MTTNDILSHIEALCKQHQERSKTLSGRAGTKQLDVCYYQGREDEARFILKEIDKLKGLAAKRSEVQP